MSKVEDMPELMDALSILQNSQVIQNDKPAWALDALNKALQEAVKKSVRYRKKSTIKLEITLTPKQLNQMHIDVSLNSNEPKPDVLTVVAFTDGQARLFGEDPAQTKLFEEPTRLRKENK